MSERYGSPGELKEAFVALENYLTDGIDDCESILRLSDVVTNPAFDTGRMTAYRDVLDFIIQNPGG